MARRLEEFSVFPIIAWITVIGFATFTIFFTTRIYSEESEAALRTAATEAYLEATP